MNWPSQNDAQFGSLVKPGKLNPGGLSSRIPHWIYPLDFLMSHNSKVFGHVTRISGQDFLKMFLP
jgi:hypothetical protein